MSGTIDLRDEAFVCDAATLEVLVAGHMLSSVIFSAVELALFDALADGPLATQILAARTHSTPDGIFRLCTALGALGLMRREDDGRWRSSELAQAALTHSGAASIVSLVRMQQRLVAPLFAHLTDGVKSGAPQFGAWPFVDAKAPPADDCYAELARHPDENALLLAAMNRASAGVGRALVEQAEIDLLSAARIVDLGGGGGQMAIELATALPSAQVTIVDGAAACGFAERRVAEAQLADRVRCVTADLREPLSGRVPRCDVVVLSGVLSDWPAAARAAIVRNAVELLVPGGQLLVSETLFDDARRGPPLPALLSLFMLLATRGDNFSGADLHELLGAAGLTGIKVFKNGAHGMRDLVSGIKP